MSRKGSGARRWEIPSAWQWAIEDYLRDLAATGQARGHAHAAGQPVAEHGPMHRLWPMIGRPWV
jgi:hypothetical protein